MCRARRAARRGVRRAFPAFAVLDTLIALIVGLGMLLGIALLAVNVRAKPSVDTPGTAAVVITWPGSQDDDVDLYVRNPGFQVVYFNSPAVGLMHLEHDDLGWRSFTDEKGRVVKPAVQQERVVVRGVDPGEYVVNVHLYRGKDVPVHVTVELWSLRGADRLVTRESVTLVREGAEQTAFRFRMNQAGDVRVTNKLPARFVGPLTYGHNPAP